MGKKIAEKVKFVEGHKEKEDEVEVKDLEVKVCETKAPQTAEPTVEAEPNAQEPTATVTSAQSSKNCSSGSKRSVCAMHKVLMKKAQGKKFKVRYNDIGIPVGETRHTLQSYIGMLARTMVPIDIPKWPEVPSEVKQKIWNDIEVQ